MALVMSACAVKYQPVVGINPSNEAEHAGWQARKQLLDSIEQWNIKGKLAVRAGNRGGHAALVWRLDPDQNERIGLSGPLGGGRVAITQTPAGATLKDTRGNVFEGANATVVVTEQLGWPVPFEQLKSWVRGLPASSAYQLELDAEGRITYLNDGDWQVRYPQYQAAKPWGAEGVSIDLPREIEITAMPGVVSVHADNGEYLGDELFVRVILSQWQ